MIRHHVHVHVVVWVQCDVHLHKNVHVPVYNSSGLVKGHTPTALLALSSSLVSSIHVLLREHTVVKVHMGGVEGDQPWE